MVRGLVFIIVSLLVLGVSAQQETTSSGSANRTLVVPVSPGLYRSNTTIKVTSNLVLIPVTVTDGNGRVVPGLEKEHFTLFEGTAQQEITHFAAEDAPVSIGIVFDASDSMEPKLHKAREALNALLNHANPADEFFLVRFSTEARLVASMTNQPQEIRDRMDSLRMGGSTALLDGVRLAMAEMAHASYTRKAIVIISDGQDNSSHWSVSELKAAVREQDVLIYAIGITDQATGSYLGPQRLTGAALLNEIAIQTGGRLFEVNKLKELPDIAAKIGGWLRNQYVLGYVPSDSVRDGSYRRIQLKVARPKGYPRLHAVWRQGYYAPKE
jgi:Ca-activated chloride channel homolog